MKWYSNMKISARIIVSFAIISFFALGMGLFSVYSLNKIDTSYSELIDTTMDELEHVRILRDDFSSCRIAVRESILQMEDSAQIEALESKVNGLMKEINEQLDGYKEVLIKNNSSEENISEIEKLRTYFGEYNDSALKIFQTAKQGADYDELSAAIKGLAASPIVGIINEPIERIYNGTNERLVTISETNSKSAEETIVITWSTIGFLVVLALGLIFPLSRSIRIPLNRLVKSAKEVAGGNFDLDLRTNRRDEFGVLNNQIGDMVETLAGIIGDIGTMAGEQSAGNTEYSIEDNKYHGGFQEVAAGINNMIDSINKENDEMVNCLQAYAQGDFGASIKKLPGKKVVINEAFDRLQFNLQDIMNDINGLVLQSTNGNLSVRMDTTKHSGDWAKLAGSLNDLLTAVVNPIREAANVLTEISVGNLKTNMQGDYKGEFLKLMEVINSTVGTLNAYIGNISETLGYLAADNYDVDVKMDYMGDFLPIKDGLTTIIARINNVMAEINSSAEQVSTGARQISESSMSLSQGATEQASAVEELNATVENIAEQTRGNVKTAQAANELAAGAKTNAEAGNDDMKNMLVAMQDINTSSNNISKIIKVIEDIAFQTNLLALNAAVEAARAGQHGKGFAVVADQVRSLAGRSQEAVKDTTVLIESTVEKVAEGMKIADATAQALEKIVGGITEISGYVGEISKSSVSQAQSIDQVYEGIGQISQVTQTNTAASEEEAAFAQELSSQAETFKNTVARFKLKN